MYNVFKSFFISLLSLCAESTEFKELTMLINFLVLDDHLEFLLRDTNIKMEK
jgi:hypothetical protein